MGALPPFYFMEWLVPHKLLVSRINPIEELEEYALRAVENKEPVGDHKMVSIKREYSMDVPPNFEQWLCDTCLLYTSPSPRDVEESTKTSYD